MMLSNRSIESTPITVPLAEVADVPQDIPVTVQHKCDGVATACGNAPSAECATCWQGGDDYDCVARHSCYLRQVRANRIIVVPASGVPASAYEA